MLMYLVVYNRRQLLYNITDKDYKFITRKGDALHTVELITGKYKDTRYQYGQVRTTLDDENQPLKLSFQWTLVKGDKNLDKDADFNDYIGSILQHIILASANFRIGNEDGADDSNDNTEELTPQ